MKKWTALEELYVSAHAAFAQPNAVTDKQAQVIYARLHAATVAMRDLDTPRQLRIIARRAYSQEARP